MLSTGILLSLLATTVPLAVKADEKPAVPQITSQTDDSTKSTVNSSLAVSDSTSQENTGASQIESQTKEPTSQASQASLTSSASAISSFSASSNQASSAEENFASSEVSSSISSSQSSSSATSKGTNFPIDSSKDSLTVDSSLSASGNVTSSSLTNGAITSQANHQDPVITSISATGSVANDITGPATLDDINVTIKASNLLPNNFLTPEGLHWSENTQVIPIVGQASGQVSSENFEQDGPTIPATAYTMNVGDSGRITNIGTTLAGTNLDLIYRVISTDATSWQDSSESSNSPIGLAFTGEQNIANSDGNSIVALYFGANNVNINYQIVAHIQIIKCLSLLHSSQRILIWHRESTLTLPIS